MKPHKVVIIGAGSAVFSPRLTADICTYKATEHTHFALVDIDEEKLGYAGRIAERIFKEGGYDKASLSLHTDRREALQDADAVITSILVGGYDAIESEIDIPMKYGIDQCIGDTLTPGGIMRCLRTLPILADVARDIMEICPNAMVLNYTNPMSMLTWGMFKAAPGIKLVGLCHSVQGTSNEWARRLELPANEIDYLCAGINHQAWFTSFKHDGVDQLPRIRELALLPEHANGDTVRMEHVKHFGYPVTESSGHVSEYGPWFRKNEDTIAQYCPSHTNSWNGKSGFIKDLYRDRHNWKKGMEEIASGKKPFKFARSVEYGSQIVNSIRSGESVVIHGSVINHGYIDNLPKGCCVEVACHVSVQELAVEATFKRDPEIVFQAMAMDPLTGMSCTLDQIRAMTRELMQAHAEWIPQFEGRLPADQPEFHFQEESETVKHVDPTEEH